MHAHSSKIKRRGSSRRNPDLRANVDQEKTRKDTGFQVAAKQTCFQGCHHLFPRTCVMSFTVPERKAGHRDADTEQRAKTKML